MVEACTCVKCALAWDRWIVRKTKIFGRFFSSFTKLKSFRSFIYISSLSVFPLFHPYLSLAVSILFFFLFVCLLSYSFVIESQSASFSPSLTLHASCLLSLSISLSIFPVFFFPIPYFPFKQYFFWVCLSFFFLHTRHNCFFYWSLTWVKWRHCQSPTIKVKFSFFIFHIRASVSSWPGFSIRPYLPVPLKVPTAAVSLL